MPSSSSYSASPFRQSVTNTFCRFHARKYLWMALALPKWAVGRALHWQPVRRTKMIASKTCRGAMGLRPPPGRRRYVPPFFRFRVGMRGSTLSQSVSETVQDLIVAMHHSYHTCPQIARY